MALTLAQPKGSHLGAAEERAANDKGLMLSMWPRHFINQAKSEFLWQEEGEKKSKCPAEMPSCLDQSLTDELFLRIQPLSQRAPERCAAAICVSFIFMNIKNQIRCARKDMRRLHEYKFMAPATLVHRFLLLAPIPCGWYNECKRPADRYSAQQERTELNGLQ